MSLQRVGVIGGGQLAWMMAKEAQKLGIALIVQTPHHQDSAVHLAADVILAAVDDAAATAQLAARCEVITFENEFVNLEALAPLARQGVCFRPSLTALAPLLDKYQQRRYLQQIGLPVPAFAPLTRESEITSFPAVLKARRHGYDGQGTFILQTPAELTAACQSLGETPALLEAYVPFERELAVIAARSASGEMVVYPLVETQQENQVCHWAIAPADISPAWQREIEEMACHLLEKLQYVGVLGIELFLTATGQILVNEVAPRTHNSGHYTLDACETSQFEMQLRAVTGLPLGSPHLRCQGAVMVNLLGYEYSQSDYGEKLASLAAIPGAYLHWYGKVEARPGRKLGHVTVLFPAASPATSQQELLEMAKRIESLWYSRELGQDLINQVNQRNLSST